MKTNKRQIGSAHVIIIVILVVVILGLLGFVFWQNFLQKKDTTSTASTTSTTASTTNQSASALKISELGVSLNNLPSSISDLAYTNAPGSTDGSNKFGELSTKSLTALDSSCGLGSLNDVSGTYSDGDIHTPGFFVKQFAQSWIWYSNNQSQCTDNASARSLADTQTSALTTYLKISDNIQAL